MDNMKRSAQEEGKGPTADVEPTNNLPEVEIVNLVDDDSSNEETEEEAEEGQPDREKDDPRKPEKGEPKKEPKSEYKRNYTEEELRKLNELKLLSPPELIAEIEYLDKELYELSQREAREIVRSKNLDNYGKTKRRFSK